MEERADDLDVVQVVQPAAVLQPEPVVELVDAVDAAADGLPAPDDRREPLLHPREVARVPSLPQHGVVRDREHPGFSQMRHREIGCGLTSLVEQPDSVTVCTRLNARTASS